MEYVKKYKLQIILPVLLAVVVLVATAMSNLFSDNSSSDYQCSLGRKYLNDLDYSGAILAYSNAIALDPTNTEARIGLAKAYSGKNEPDFAVQILTESLNEKKMNPDIAEALMELYTERGDWGSVISILDILLDQTDDEDYHEMLADVIANMYARPHPISMGSAHELMLKDGTVMSRGQNVLGQLGITDGLGDRYFSTDTFAPAGFSGVAERVFCAGNTSYVIDDTGKLWAAGENRWGQIGNSYGLLSTASGWFDVAGGENTVYVCGDTGTAYVLKKDGTLYHSGAYSGQVLSVCTGLPTISRISASEGYVYALGTNGVLYRNESRTPDSWQRLTSAAVRVTDYAACGSVYAWVDSDGRYMSMGTYYPGNWEYTNGGYLIPDTRIASLETNGNMLIYTDLNGVLYTADGSDPQKIEMDSTLVNLYSDAGNVYAVYESGTALVWKKYETQYSIAAEPANG
ncbi:MAG: tetratricopeptide repeat protein [Ruminococcaceae bacterium]|nr:tetratricopeptide repeat protein [Oscillospiraceae bacterium]